MDVRIEKVAVWRTTDGRNFTNAHEAQRHQDKIDVASALTDGFSFTQDEAMQIAHFLGRRFKMTKFPNNVRELRPTA